MRFNSKYIASTLYDRNGRVSGRNVHVHVAGLRVEPTPNSEYVPISVLAVPGNARLWYHHIGGTSDIGGISDTDDIGGTSDPAGPAHRGRWICTGKSRVL